MSIKKLKSLGWNLLWQPLVATIFVGVVLYCLGMVTGASEILWAVGAGALSSSSYIVFVTPQSAVARSRRIIGGYVVGAIVGLFVHWILTVAYDFASANLQFHNSHLFWISAAISVGVAMVMMVLLGVEHPPAAGLSLVLVLDIHEYMTLVMILIAAVALSALRHALRCHLINLVGER